MPDNSELFKNIVRATTNVPADGIDDAVAAVRALFAKSAPKAEAEPKAEPAHRSDAKAGHDRMEKGGKDR